MVGNAIKFTDKGSVSINITFKNIYKENTDSKYKQTGVIELLFSIKDTGIGMTSNEIDTIYNYFTKKADDKYKVYEGIGLGLSICKKLIQMMDGQIWVESEYNKGSTFYFTISLGF